jgi:hypothetical protein
MAWLVTWVIFLLVVSLPGGCLFQRLSGDLMRRALPPLARRPESQGHRRLGNPRGITRLEKAHCLPLGQFKHGRHRWPNLRQLWFMHMHFRISCDSHLPKELSSITAPSGLVLQRQFVTARSVTVDVMRPPPDDPKVCGQQKIVRWPLASA